MNRFEMYSDDNRRKFIESVERNLGMNIEIPNDFEGLPSTNPQMSVVVRFAEKREKEDIPNIWKLFELALNMDFNSNDDRNNFIEIYDKVISKPVAKFNISVGLFKIRPDIFLNLDYTNREFLIKKFNIHIKDRIYGKEYLTLIDEVKFKLGEETLIEFSYNAWKSKFNRENKDSKNIQIENNNNINYWLISANIKYYNHEQAFEDNGFIDWKQLKRDYKVEDIVYIYRTDTHKIGYKCKITEINLTIDEIPDDSKYFSKNDNNHENSEKLFMRLQLIESFDYNELSYKNLMKLKLINGAPQGHIHVNKNLKEYIEKVINKSEKEFEEYSKEMFLKDVYITDIEYDRLSKLLSKKKNIILQGAPGVGKTFMAKRLAYSIIGKKDDEKIKTIQFHQNYSYEDFIEGYRPTENGYELEKGIFYNFCKKAENDPNEPYFFIIDEINRGNLSKIFGELMMLIESDKRGDKLTLAYSKIGFSVPKNLYIIGMMNTADRSLALMDYALRRRFAFYKVKPAFESNMFKEYQNKLNNEKFNKLIERVKLINNDIDNDLSLGEGFEIGHSYFCNLEEVTDEDIKLIVDYEILPLLEEYWFDDTDKYNECKDKLNGVVNG